MNIVIAGGHGRIVALLDVPDVRRRTLEVLNGPTRIEDAVASLRPALGGGGQAV